MASATLLVELLTEELPARGLRTLGERFASGIHDALSKLGFIDAVESEPSFKFFATPRRLAVRIPRVRDFSPDQRVERRGPAVAAGLRDGEPTPALIGFAKSCGVAVDRLERLSDGRTDYFSYRSTKPGQPLAYHLASIVEASIKALPATKLMRWGASEVQFIRPVQGLVMLWSSEVVPGTVLGLEAGNVTRGHRFLGRAEIPLQHADDYETALHRDGYVIADFDRRAHILYALLCEHARRIQGATLAGEGLIEEVSGLIECCAVYEGRFDPVFLEVPQECLTLTMQANQKYFPLLDAKGKLLDRFLIASNMDIVDPSQIIQGNERVLRARLADAKFFFDQDRKQSLESQVAKLAHVVYHNKLGTQLERTERIERLAGWIAGLLGEDEAMARRAAHLCKADLLTGMVGEFPELQGTMGMHYARHDGEPEIVARAIEAHYRPRFAGDTLPEDGVGDCVALADKLDTLVGIYGIGLAPSGDKDPFALRRAALGVLRILIEHQLPLQVTDVLQGARDGYQGRAALAPGVVDDLYAFILDRLRSYLREQGRAVDEIEAVLAQDSRRMDLIVPRLDAVHAFLELPEAASLAAANKRIANILKKSEASDLVKEELLVEHEERALYDKLRQLQPRVESEMERSRFDEALISLAGVREPVDAFFDKVLVNAEDERLRRNRLGLLTQLSRLMNRVADISKLARP